MKNYRDERTFEKSFVKALKDKGYFVQKIEAKTMGAGIPDVYVASKYFYTGWVELKRIRENYDQEKVYAPSLSTGQRSWARSYFLHTSKALRLVICFNDAIGVYEWMGQEEFDYSNQISVTNRFGGLALNG